MQRLPQAERVSAARGMHGWLQRLSEPGDQDAPSAPSPVAQERNSRTKPGRGRKRVLEGGATDSPAPAEAPQGSQGRRGGGVTAKESRPPPHRTPFSLSGSRGAASPLPLPTLSPCYRRTPPPTPAAAAGREPAKGGAATTASQPPPESEHPPKGGQRRRRATEGQPQARGTEGPAAKTPEPLARVLLSRRVH